MKTLAQQEEHLKKMETFSALQETNRMLKIDRDKLEQELQQAQAKVRLKCCMSWFVSFFIVSFVFYFKIVFVTAISE